MKWKLGKARAAALGAAALTMAAAAVILCFNTGQPGLPVFGPAQQEKNLVLDAGHGGMDGGAVGAGGTCEKDINLSIAKRVEALAGFFGIHTVMTRQADESLDYSPEETVRHNKIRDIKKRENIAENTPNAIFLSVHLNKFTDGKYSGAQVFYSKNNPESALLAAQLQENMREGLNPQNNRQEKPAQDSVYLMKKLTCPAAIVECGFLSNPEEESLLKQEPYHKRAAVCIVSGYLKYLDR